MDIQYQIGEEFFGFVLCKRGLKVEAVGTTIKEFLHDLTLPIDDYRSQGYDGNFPNMADCLSGATAN